MKKQSLNILTIFLLTILGIASLSAQKKGGEIINGESQESGQTYALVVGISDYQDDDIPDLNYADKDAEAFANYLRSPGGGQLDQDHLKVLINEQATMAQFAIALDWLKEVAQENDKVILYFSGHGDVDNNSVSQPGFLLCWDVNAHVYLAGGMPLPLLRDAIATLSARNKAQVIFFADACRSGKLSGSSIGGGRLTATSLAEAYSNEIKILSCQPDEYSIEGEQWGGGRGAFSYHLIDGLYGMADANEDQIVTLKELRYYLEDKVPTEVAPFPQMPLTVGDVREEMSHVSFETLAKLREKKQSEIEIFGAIASRGFVEIALSNVDSSITDIYYSFKKALEDHRFLEPENNCAESYYTLLIQNQNLESIHSTLTREYAAALQDEAQQELNTILNSGLTRSVLFGLKSTEQYKVYPEYLERAIQLLGKDHYMYRELMARMYIFKGWIAKGKQKKNFYLKAIEWQPELPHPYNYMIWRYNPEKIDSVLYYAEKAMELAPKWINPYTNLSDYYEQMMEDVEKAEYWLLEADKVDSNSIFLNYRKSHFYASQNKYDLAEKYIRKVLSSTSKNICFPCAKNALGIILYDQDQHAEAREIFLEILKDSLSEMPLEITYLNIGNTYDEERNFEKAYEFFDLSLETNPQYIGTYINYSTSLFDQGYESKAFELLNSGVEMNPNDNRILALQADYLKRYGYLKEAEITYKKCIQLDSSDPILYLALNDIYIENGELHRAVRITLKALEIGKDSLEVFDDLGGMYFDLLDHQSAVWAYSEIIRLDSNNAPAWNFIGAAYQNLGEYERALSHIQKSIELDSAYALAYNNLGIVYRKTNRYEESKTQIDKAISLDSTNVQFYINYVSLYFRQKRYPQVIQLAHKGLHFDSTSHVLLGNMGAAYANSGDFENGLKYTLKCLKYDPENTVRLTNLGIIQTNLGNYEEAEKAFLKCINLNQNNSKAIDRLVFLYKQQNQLNKINRLLEDQIERRPADLNLLDYAGQVYRDLGEYNKSDSAYFAIYKHHPHVAHRAYLNIGINARIQKDYLRAKEFMKAAIDIDSSDWVCYANLTRVLRQLGQIDELLNYSQKLVRNIPDNPNSYNELGLAYYVFGDLENAENSYKYAIKLDSTSWLFKLNLSAIYSETEEFTKGYNLIQQGLLENHDISGFQSLNGLLAFHIPGKESEAQQAYQNAKVLQLKKNFEGLNLARLSLLHGEQEQAWHYLEEGLKLADEALYLKLILNSNDIYAEFRKDSERWEALMQKYFPVSVTE